MSIELITWALKQPIKPSSVKFVLVVLANCASAESGLAYPSIAYLSSATGQDRKTVLSNMAKLREWGVVEDTGRRVGSTQQVVVYKVHAGPMLFNAIQNSTENGTVTGTGPKFPPNGTVFPNKEAQKRDTEPSVNIRKQTARSTSEKTGCRLPEDWEVSTELLSWCFDNVPEDIKNVGDFINSEAATFRDHWKAKTGKDATKLDWDATFRNWIRKAIIFRSGGANERNQRHSAIDRVAGNVRKSNGHGGASPGRGVIEH